MTFGSARSRRSGLAAAALILVVSGVTPRVASAQPRAPAATGAPHSSAPAADSEQLKVGGHASGKLTCVYDCERNKPEDIVVQVLTVGIFLAFVVLAPIVLIVRAVRRARPRRRRTPLGVA